MIALRVSLNRFSRRRFNGSGGLLSETKVASSLVHLVSSVLGNAESNAKYHLIRGSIGNQSISGQGGNSVCDSVHSKSVFCTATEFGSWVEPSALPSYDMHTFVIVI